jgi:hypothetical protein
MGQQSGVSIRGQQSGAAHTHTHTHTCTYRDLPVACVQICFLVVVLPLWCGGQKL